MRSNFKWNIIKGLAMLWRNKAISFPTNIELFKSLVLAIRHGRCERLDVVCGSGEANPSLWKPVLHGDAWCVTLRAKNKMSTDRSRSVSCQEFLLSSVNSYHSFTMYAVTIRCKKVILRGTVDVSRRNRWPCKSWKDNMKEWTGQSLSSLLWHCRRQKSMYNHHSRGVCQSTTTTPGRNGN